MRNVLLASVAAMVFSANAANAGYLINHCSDGHTSDWTLTLDTRHSKNEAKFWEQGRPARVGTFVGVNLVDTITLPDMQIVMYNDGNGTWSYNNGAASGSITCQRAYAKDLTSTDVSVTMTPDASGLQNIPVFLGSSTISMAIDTGASSMLLSPEVANMLLSKGGAVEIGTGKAILADGSVHNNKVISVKYVVIGGRWITNVRAAVGPEGSSLLLGIGVLQMFGKFSIDVPHSQLIFAAAN
jgi:predicted aspartyl protease